jgi:tetratricopeptide (TPR) repeat protein
MKHFTIMLFAILASLFHFQLEALNRDFKSSSNEIQTYFCHDCVKFFDYFGKKESWSDIDYYSQLIPVCKGKACERCFSIFHKQQEGIYAPYVVSKDNFELLKDHLLYSASNTACQCYWPEISKQAAKINDNAYDLFLDLFANTELSIIVKDPNEQKNVLLSRPWNAEKFSLRGVVLCFINKAFFYSHYYRICQKLDRYSKQKFNEHDYSIIQDKLEYILDVIGAQYLKLYDSCYSKHPNNRISQELFFVPHFFETIEKSSKETLNFKSTLKLNKSSNKNEPDQTKWLDSQILLKDGRYLNDFLQYQESIKWFTKSIKLNPSNIDAHIERAMAYFETNQISLALKDYKAAKKLAVVPPFKPDSHKAILTAAVYIPENKTDFSKGLISGSIDGAKVATVEFVPSLFSSCRGILNGLWAFACSPTEVSQEMINTCYAIGEFIGSHSTEEYFQCAVPELKELSLSWDMLNDKSRGQKIGYIIGKYGIDIFAPVGVLGGVNKIRALKSANTMFTLECCASSKIKQSKILEESGKLALKRQNLVSEITTKGKIYPKNANAVPHILQDKHAWEKVVSIKKPIKANGNIEENFKAIMTLLEKEGIMSESYFSETLFSKGSIRVNKHSKVINGQTVEAVFEVNTETKLSLLQDAWVVTNK